ncbi:MAG: PLDc N-terminal domain-containing protein [Candidatus Aenigmatarchaeota archaeon]|nr:MAG: PLDc N-terminal domain-containing protein [Candidatus Aenigmarchaeota archaeon]
MAINETLIREVMMQIPTGAPILNFIIPLILIILAILALSLLLFIGWLWMIIDCAKREKFKSGDRVVWILLLVLLGPLGMILYYFMVMRE